LQQLEKNKFPIVCMLFSDHWVATAKVEIELYKKKYKFLTRFSYSRISTLKKKKVEIASFCYTAKLKLTILEFGAWKYCNINSAELVGFISWCWVYIGLGFIESIFELCFCCCHFHFLYSFCFSIFISIH
jgi:hypothetical protein